MSTIEAIVKLSQVSYSPKDILIQLASGEVPWQLEDMEDYKHLAFETIEGTDIQWGVFEAEGKTYKVVWELDSYSTYPTLHSVKEVKPVTKEVLVYE